MFDYRLASKLLVLLPKLYGLQKSRAYECLVQHMASQPDSFKYLCHHRVDEALWVKEPVTQLALLRLMDAVLPNLTAQQAQHFLPSLVQFSSHNSPSCRQVLYSCLMYLHQHFTDAQDTDSRTVYDAAKCTLLKAVSDQDTELRNAILGYWTGATTSLSLPDLILFVLRDLYSTDSEETFLHTCSHVLLQNTHASAYYTRPLFEEPLQNCKFWEMRVTPTWQARHASMVPLFTNTQASSLSDGSSLSLPQLVALTQGGNEAIGAILATQDKKFTPTQTVEMQSQSATFNMDIGSAMQEEMDFVELQDKASRAPTQGSTGLLFSVSSSGNPRTAMYKRIGLGRTSMMPKKSTDETDSKTLDMNLLVRRRFVRQQDREKQVMHFARLEDKRRQLRQRLHHERKLRREAQVTMFREYRVGELPDIQIPHRAIIDPLQALAARDITTAAQVFIIVINGVRLYVQDDTRKATEWTTEFQNALCKILETSVRHFPQVIMATLQLLFKGNLSCDSEIITRASICSSQEALGILFIESKIVAAQKQQRFDEPSRKRQRCAAKTQTFTLTDAQVSKLSLHLAELYGSIGMWDAVRGILHSDLSSLNASTQEALHAETLNQHMRAYELYLEALAKGFKDQPVEEQRVWEERVCFAATELGQWRELETFVTHRFLTDSNTGQVQVSRLWDQSRPTTAVLPAFVNARLMNLLGGAATDGGLLQFVADSMKQTDKKLLLEDSMSMQLAILSVHQEKSEVARAFLDTTKTKLLQELGHHSPVSPKPLSAMLRRVQLILETEDFLKVDKRSNFGDESSHVANLCAQWMNNLPSGKDETFLAQCIALYRDLYVHFFKKKIQDKGTVQLLDRVRAVSHIAVIELALKKRNPHLANEHLKKLKSVLRSGLSIKKLSIEYEFLSTRANLVRGQQKGGMVQFRCLIEAWCKHMSEANHLQEESSDVADEVQYLSLESQLCTDLCTTIRSLGDTYDANDRYMKVLATKFPNVTNTSEKESWYPNLLQCSFNDLKNAALLCENGITKKQGKITDEDNSSAQNRLARFCEDSVSNWSEHVNVQQYHVTLVSASLKAMAAGSNEAHFNFPRLIHLMDDHPHLVATFQKEADAVPVWMLILWISHIMIYIDKNPGLALQPLVLKLAAQYPQAVFFPFTVSKNDYKFDGAVGSAAQKMCSQVENILAEECHLLHKFSGAISLVREYHVDFKTQLWRILLMEELKPIIGTLQQLSEKHFGSESSSVIDDSLQCKGFLPEIKEYFNREFGIHCSKITRARNLDTIKRGVKKVLSLWQKDLKQLSPWLATFQSSNNTKTIEIPGQYTGFSKPLVEYHTNITNFDINLQRMQSLRSPIVITIHGDDEKPYKFLVKSGEDQRTDQRIELLFTLINNVYQRSSVTRQLSVQPHIKTYNVIPMSADVGILQWVDSTEVLKNVIEDEEILEEKERESLLKTVGEFSNLHSKLKYSDKKTCVRTYTDYLHQIPEGILCRSLLKMASNYESYCHLRTNLCSSHAALSISQWLLGIGDRHLKNFLLEKKTAKLVGIDFGHHFESATQFLGTPELVPFRMSPQIASVMQPLGTNGIPRETMVACLQAMVDSKNLLLAAIEAFVKEPTNDWLQFVRLQEKSTSIEKVELYSSERIELISQKLAGINPCVVIQWALNKNQRLKANEKKLLSEAVSGTDMKRSSLPRYELTVPQQVDVLLDLATDPNILGRTYYGWTPLI